MWVRTLCPLSSSTRNMALGSGSTTVPSTRIASSLGFASELTTSWMRGSGQTSRATAVETHHERAKGARGRPVRLHQGELRYQVGRWGLPGDREDLGAVVADRHGVLEVGRAARVGRH